MSAVRVGSHTLEVSNADKVLFPDDGITKGDVVEYYRRIAPQMLPHLEDRPLALHRFPDGIDREDLASGDPRAVQRAARVLRRVLDDLGIAGYVKSTGSKGLHAHIPLDGSDSFEIVRGFARDLAQEMVRRAPDELTIEQRKANRKGRLFVDWLRNSYGQHAVAPYSLRALPGAPVAVPLDWDEVTANDFDPRRYRLANVFRRLGHKRDPWEGMRRRAQSVSHLARRLHAAG